MAKIGYPPSSYRARFSRDYLKIEPHVFAYLERKGRPEMVIRSDLEEYVRGQIDTRWMDENRIPHCISDAMHLLGYEKRSNRGRCWDLIYDSVSNLPVIGWSIRVADVRTGPRRPWKKPDPGHGDDFYLVDTHEVRTRKSRSLKPPVPTWSVVPLTAFC